jgi:hypothetical protein
MILRRGPEKPATINGEPYLCRALFVSRHDGRTPVGACRPPCRSTYPEGLTVAGCGAARPGAS